MLALRPADAAAKLNLALCEKLLYESGGTELKLDQQRQLLARLGAVSVDADGAAPDVSDTEVPP